MDGNLTAGQGVLTVWSDIGCPWASAALHSLGAAAERIGHPLLIDHRAFPLELFNRRPTPKHIVESEIVAIAARRPELGWRLWAAREWEYPVTTLPPMEAVQAAKHPDVGGLRASTELDAALRRGYYVDSRCVSLRPVILEIAGECPHVDAGALAEALADGAGSSALHQDWRTASGPSVQGSPHLFAEDGVLPPEGVHNPGASYAWTGDPDDGGFPRLDEYRTEWADQLVGALAAHAEGTRATARSAARPTARAVDPNGDDR
jgi:predicted DsbA family dithiol-disulfide isomerase